MAWYGLQCCSQRADLRHQTSSGEGGWLSGLAVVLLILTISRNKHASVLSSSDVLSVMARVVRAVDESWVLLLQRCYI